MSYTVVNDDGVVQVRASITSSIEMQELIDKLKAANTKLIEQEKPNDRPEPG